VAQVRERNQPLDRAVNVMNDTVRSFRAVLTDVNRDFVDIGYSFRGRS